MKGRPLDSRPYVSPPSDSPAAFWRLWPATIRPGCVDRRHSLLKRGRPPPSLTRSDDRARGEVAGLGSFGLALGRRSSPPDSPSSFVSAPSPGGDVLPRAPSLDARLYLGIDRVIVALLLPRPSPAAHLTVRTTLAGPDDPSTVLVARPTSRRGETDEPPPPATAREEGTSPPRIEGGPGEDGAFTRAASGARRAPTAADEAPYPSYDANDDPTMTAVRWTNDVSSDDTDGATGPPALPMGTSTMEEGRGRRSRLVVDVGSISASRRRRVADESSNTTPARFCRRTTFRPTMTRTDDSGSINSITDTSRGSQTGIRRATGGVIEWIEPTTASSSTRFDGSKRRAAKIGIDRCAEGSQAANNPPAKDHVGPRPNPAATKVTDDGAGEDNTGSTTTGTYNIWCLELHFAGGGTALRNQGDLFLGFLEGDIVGEVATGRLSMILDIVRGVKRTLATCLAPHLGVTPTGTHLESGP
ncbi:hypothetical protein THAOC_12518 [Thalassiosira oceanica]|uniref:Uncharacterized protein n=1 Tax=Thalassiosira oceanica TaxID=159749 RepID=K0SNL7_THAOC|nr:hypothetical protein THAOC_12518 [Thalassiosira oceanica]|eukprot:EJK66559.1 hypothetical protein THAOC_12518 [Thalassiosira oceanica]